MEFPQTKTFLSRLQLFLQRLPELWASTSTINSTYAGTLSRDATLPGAYANSSPKRNILLFDMEKLEIPASERAVFLAVNKKVLEYMYRPQYDPSHDYEHIQRVVKHVHDLYVEEKAAGRVDPKLDVTTMYLAAMMHDVGESKYLVPGRTQEEEVTEELLKCGVDHVRAEAVVTIVVNVSFTRENKAEDKSLIQGIIAKYPELAFVQDADRLDALGPSGQSRTFVFGGLSKERKGQTIHTSVQLQHSRFVHYVPLMKTEAGKAKAEKKWAWMENFRAEWHEDTDVSSVL